ncbi:MAG: SPOR domain-containing protein [Desulfotignum sp.]|nr:SPOR domain-containing protein [Desulfotignum sp.]
MIPCLRNISIRLWLTLMVAVPACFYFLPWFSQLSSRPGQAGFFIGLTGVCFGVISALMHLTGVRMIQKRIHEAKVWEQAGIPVRAEKKYLQAVRIYDSFLPSPVRSKKLTLLMTRSLARFALTFDRKSDAFKQAVRVYLSLKPHDDALAALWLEQLAKDDEVTTRDQALLTRLAQTHHRNSGLVPLLARVFLDTGRMDFIARQVYAKVMEDPDVRIDFQQDIQTLTGATFRKKAVYSDEAIREATGKQAISGKTIRTSVPVAGILEKIRQAGRNMRCRLAGAGWAAIPFKKQHDGSGRPIQARWRFYLKAGIMGALCAGALMFIFYPVFFVDEPKPVEKTKTVIEERVPKPFTIQVAAYLKENHARQFVVNLTQKGVDARIKTTTGGGNTWYLIQVSEFEDRQMAAAYGNHLISENIIEEFFVSNKD